MVDNTIVRDPATDVPKIPGSSIAGVTREYYTIYAMENECTSQDEAKKKENALKMGAKKIFGDENKKGTLRFLRWTNNTFSCFIPRRNCMDYNERAHGILVR